MTRNRERPFLADADLNQAIVTAWPARTVARLSKRCGSGLEGMDDSEVLRLAASEGRIVVSHDASTMPVHFLAFLREGKRSPGLLLVPQDAPVRDVIDAVVLIWSASSPGGVGQPDSSLAIASPARVRVLIIQLHSPRSNAGTRDGLVRTITKGGQRT